MSVLRTHLLPVLAATIWISVSEFLRNEALFKDQWLNHFAAMGVDFPDSTVNNLTWGLWSLVFAIVLRVLRARFTLLETALFGWFAVFVMMWIAIGNLGVLPWGLMPIALPWSLVEAAGAAWIIDRLMHRNV